MVVGLDMSERTKLRLQLASRLKYIYTEQGSLLINFNKKFCGTDHKTVKIDSAQI